MERHRQSRYHSLMTKTPKRPRDTNQLAKFIVDTAIGEKGDTSIEESLDSSAVSFGRSGGVIGGKVRAEKLSSEQRSEIARAAARKRWTKG